MIVRTVTLVLGVSLAIGIALGFGPEKSPDPTPTASPAMTAQAATTYQIDPIHSTSIFGVRHMDASMFHGMFDNVTGTIDFDPDDLAALALDVTIDVESIHTGSHERNGQLNQHLMSPDFFNAKEHPQMTFKSTAAKKVDAETCEVTGDLTIRGVTREITASIDVVGTAETRRGKVAGFLATFQIDRTDFEVSYMAESPMLGNDVTITVVLEAGAR